MPLYNCEICDVSTKLKSNFTRHLNTHKHIKNVEKYKSLLKKKNKTPSFLLNYDSFEPQIPLFNEEQKEENKNKNIYNTNNKKLKCNRCNKTFTRKDNLKRHKQQSCIEGKKYLNIDYKELFYNMKNTHEKEKEDFKKHIELLINKVGNTTNTTINNTQNIQLNSYGKEDLSHINELLKTQLLKIPYAMIPKLIKEVHFNDTKPENKNICLPNKKDKLIKIYKNNKWIYKDKDQTINDLVDSKYNILDNHYDTVDKDNLTPFIKMNYQKFRKYYDEGDKELSEQIKKECNLILLNNR